ncbi:Retinoblastoma-binding protein 5 [Chytriomyces hyalinus]|nr:Retinoblastoma-binding protein 5 [Chytriomyces hyalinus]
MNLTISVSATDYPEGVAYTLDREGASMCRFNDSGNMAAIGTTDGSILLMDLDTKGFANELVGHVAPVTSLSWEHSGRFLLSGSKDWNCILWNTHNSMGNANEKVLRFASPVLSAAIYPGHSQTQIQMIVCCLSQYPYLITVERTPEGIWSEDRGFLVELEEGAVDITGSPEYAQTTACAYDKSGKYVFLGNAKGIVTVVENETRKVICQFRPSGSASIRGFQFSPDNLLLAVNSADKNLRSYFLDKILASSASQIIEPDFKYFDSIDQNRWAQCVFSPNSKYFVGGSAAKNSHKIYIWEQETGALSKLLEIQKDNLLDLAWHPKLPILMSVSSAGTINIWTAKISENWSAFAPDFRELDENVEYEEMEDEFDMVEDSEKKLQLLRSKMEDDIVDIMD